MVTQCALAAAAARPAVRSPEQMRLRPDTSLLEIVTDALRAADLLSGRVMLGLSGGVDSMVLLNLLAAVRTAHPLQLAALHVNHQISPLAGQWAQLCAERCAALSVPFREVRVTVPRRAGESLEAVARAARYAVFQTQETDALALAHHLDDQAETVLLQLLRGAGARGLAAMPLVRILNRETGLRVVRPLLEVPRTAIEAYARHRRLAWVEDESNASLDFDRNYLRQAVLPRIGERFPGYRQTWLRASRNLADLSELADELASG